MRVGLWIRDNKEMFDRLFAEKDKIETAFGNELDWDRLENRKASFVGTNIPGLDFDKKGNYPELMNGIIDTAVSLRSAFKPYI